MIHHPLINMHPTPQRGLLTKGTPLMMLCNIYISYLADFFHWYRPDPLFFQYSYLSGIAVSVGHHYFDVPLVMMFPMAPLSHDFGSGSFP